METSEPTPDGHPGGLLGFPWRWLVALALGLLLLVGLILPPPALGNLGPAQALAAALGDSLSSRDPLSPADTLSVEERTSERGDELFGAHCAGCHVNGGNIIRRGKTLRLAALARNGIDGPEAIASIAAAGVGQMGGYGEVLGPGGPEAVAAWVWQQALEGWPRS